MNLSHKQKKSKMTGGNSVSVRASIRIAPEIHRALGGIGAEKKISLAWAVRNAGGQYAKEGTAPSRKATA